MPSKRDPQVEKILNRLRDLAAKAGHENTPVNEANATRGAMATSRNRLRVEFGMSDDEIDEALYEPPSAGGAGHRASPGDFDGSGNPRRRDAGDPFRPPPPRQRNSRGRPDLVFERLDKPSEEWFTGVLEYTCTRSGCLLIKMPSGHWLIAALSQEDIEQATRQWIALVGDMEGVIERRFGPTFDFVQSSLGSLGMNSLNLGNLGNLLGKGVGHVRNIAKSMYARGMVDAIPIFRAFHNVQDDYDTAARRRIEVKQRWESEYATAQG